MRFGPVPVAEAEGAILAHSLPLAVGRLRKGVVLSAGHVAQMQAEGIAQVTVARLEPGDVHEDEAAHRLAEACVQDDQPIHLSAAFTGRVNVIADAPGVVRLEAEAIRAANAVDPMITIATVPEHHQIHQGGMIATVKIISYAVNETKLSQAIEHLTGAVGLATPIYQTAGLILTETGAPSKKGQAAIEQRLTGLGMALEKTCTCAHEEEALAEEIAGATGDVILILTGSATSDIRDTGPEALRRAGGEVTRFGIPVDPGNLLFLGAYQGKPVIGLPGSARSPVLHGADWVLARVACGVPLEDADFAAMGVGGLLKEIPTRPQPRRGTSS